MIPAGIIECTILQAFPAYTRGLLGEEEAEWAHEMFHLLAPPEHTERSREELEARGEEQQRLFEQGLSVDEVQRMMRQRR